MDRRADRAGLVSCNRSGAETWRQGGQLVETAWWRDGGDAVDQPSGAEDRKDTAALSGRRAGEHAAGALAPARLADGLGLGPLAARGIEAGDPLPLQDA